MKKNVLFFMIIAVFLVGFTIDSHADSFSERHGKGMSMCNKMPGMAPCMCGQHMDMAEEQPMMGMKMMAMITKLGLDETQTATFKAMHLKMTKERIQKNAEISIAELELREVLEKDPVDMKSAEAKVMQIESLRAELQISHIKTHEAIKAMLTPEQRKKLESFMQMGPGMMGHCRMMENRGEESEMHGMKSMGEDEMHGGKDVDDSDMPDEGHAH